MLLKKILSSAMADHKGFIKGWANLWAVRTILLCAFDHQEGSCLFRVVHFRKPVSIKPQTTDTHADNR